MTLQEARETVILAGRKLVESGLIARTWGNVSCRISSSHFVITPSGRDYLSLTPDEIVEISIDDCSYSGTVKPSSEKGIHAEVYKLHPEVNFIIHTHQIQASAVSALKMSSMYVPKQFPNLRGEVFCASYGLPGTKKLRRSVSEALAHSKGKAVIMKNHGALCFGSDHIETFEVARELENACEHFTREQYLRTRDISLWDLLEAGCFAVSQLTGRAVTVDGIDPLSSCESARIQNGFRLNFDSKSFDILYDKPGGIPLPEEFPSGIIEMHNEIYKKNKHINHIIHAVTPGAAAVSCAGIRLKPLLDDFAQIAGTSVKTTGMEPSKIAAALKGSSAVLIQNKGALCCGASREDALAAGMVVEKNCIALIAAALFGKVKYLSLADSMLMRFVYLKKYSKQVYKK